VVVRTPFSLITRPEQSARVSSPNLFDDTEPADFGLLERPQALKRGWEPHPRAASLDFSEPIWFSSIQY
jgi:hypothetical protein